MFLMLNVDRLLNFLNDLIDRLPKEKRTSSIYTILNV